MILGSTLQKVLAALDALDRHFFDKSDVNNSIESMYSKIFAGVQICKENPIDSDAPIVLLLCKWAVGSHRSGEHRALAVARLLELRQSEITSATDVEMENLSNGGNSQSNEQDTIKMETRDDVPATNNEQSSGTAESGGTNGANNIDDDGDSCSGALIYHNLLLSYLDNDAPIGILRPLRFVWMFMLNFKAKILNLDDSTPAGRATFASLVHLFSALIRHDIFSHDAYLCTLVARGDLSTNPSVPTPNTSATPIQQIQSVNTPGHPHSHPAPSTPASVSSVTPGATPHHDIMEDSRGPLFPPLPRIPDVSLQRQSADIDDRSSENIDDDLDRILQDITQEQQNNMNQVSDMKCDFDLDVA